MAIICTRMAIFGTFWPFLLMEPFWLYLSLIDVKQMRLCQPFEKMVMVLMHKNHPKIENNKYHNGHFGPFFLVSSDDHLEYVLVTKRTLQNSLWCFISRDILQSVPTFLSLQVLRSVKSTTPKRDHFLQTWRDPFA